jgi:hypothetical protein
MMTRNVHEPTHNQGMPLALPDAHGQMVYAPMIVGPSVGLSLPAEHIAYDPSDVTTATEQHYAPDQGSFAPVATRNLPLATRTYTTPRWSMPSDLTAARQD